MNKDVSVIIPSFNRSHLLETIIPSYIQDCVVEIIVIDDGSTDNTSSVLKSLSSKYPILRYVSNKTNKKQMYSKNKGAKLAIGKYLYFGDDDSFLTEGSLNVLRLAIENLKHSIVASRALYMKSGETLEQCLCNNNVLALKPNDLVNPITFEHHFYKISPEPLEVNTCQACIMMLKSDFLSIMFFEGFIGSCQREESDFFLRARRFGYKIFYYSDACQINLPRAISYGGSWSSPLGREISLFCNHSLFVFRNLRQIMMDYGFFSPILHFLSIYYMKFRNVFRNLFN